MSSKEMSAEWLTLVQAAMERLERDGLIRKTGRYRNGQPEYTTTEKGKRIPQPVDQVDYLDA
jgi:DNA-binding HxlR family transcriptional regulator